MTTETMGMGHIDAITDAECKQIAWQMFCQAHPVEAHAHDAEAFWKFFQRKAPGVSRERMVELLKECAE